MMKTRIGMNCCYVIFKSLDLMISLILKKTYPSVPQHILLPFLLQSLYKLNGPMGEVDDRMAQVSILVQLRTRVDWQILEACLYDVFSWNIDQKSENSPLVTFLLLTNYDRVVEYFRVKVFENVTQEL